MSGAHRLHRFSFTTVGRSPEPPVAAISDCITRFPEVGCDSRIRTVLQQPDALAAFDLVCRLLLEKKKANLLATTVFGLSKRQSRLSDTPALGTDSPGSM